MSGEGAGDSYYGRPILKEPVWTWEIPAYFLAGGLAGASAALAFGAELAGQEELARRVWPVSLAGVLVAPPLLISDLGRSERFLNMFRVLKPSSPMSVGAWILLVVGGAVTAATGSLRFGRWRGLGRVSGGAAAALGLPLATYTAVLIADTAVPAWHEARRELPWVFAGSSLASAGGAAVIVTPVGIAAPARRLAAAGAVVELGSARLMERRLGELGEPYRSGRGRRFGLAAGVLTAAGALALTAFGGRDRRVAAAAGVTLLAGSFCERWSVFEAGRASARDPRYVVGPQRARLDARE
jgi:Polysulphide reductase, NrfD